MANLSHGVPRRNLSVLHSPLRGRWFRRASAAGFASEDKRDLRRAFKLEGQRMIWMVHLCARSTLGAIKEDMNGSCIRNRHDACSVIKVSPCILTLSDGGSETV